jgi:large subunit ribosomal protein L17
MHHRKAGRQLRRTSEQRLALLRNLAISLIEHGAIETTEAKAKELRPFVEKLITKGKLGTLHARRHAARHVHVRRAADTLFRDVGPAYATRTGGYTRILKTGHRKGDGADMARIELIGIAADRAAGVAPPRPAPVKKPAAGKASAKAEGLAKPTPSTAPVKQAPAKTRSAAAPTSKVVKGRSTP